MSHHDGNIRDVPTWLKEYIGDGVYVSFDGFNTWLHTDDLTGQQQFRNSIGVEPETLAALLAFDKRMRAGR